MEERWGAVKVDAARRIEEMAPGAVEKFGVHLTSETDKTVGSITENISGVDVVSSDGTHATIRASRQGVKTLGKLSPVAGVYPSPENIQKYSLTGPARYTQADEAFNDQESEFASGVKVGVVPADLRNGCVWDTDHKAFEHTTFTYQDIQPCDTDSDCGKCTNEEGDCKKIDYPGRITNNLPSDQEVCVNDKENSSDSEETHAFGAASRIGQNRPDGNGNWIRTHAAEAHIYVSNLYEPSTNAWDRLKKDMEWMASEGVKIISRSFGTGPHFSSYDTLAWKTDQFAYQHPEVTVFVAAGNHDSCYPLGVVVTH